MSKNHQKIFTHNPPYGLRGIHNNVQSGVNLIYCFWMTILHNWSSWKWLLVSATRIIQIVNGQPIEVVGWSLRPMAISNVLSPKTRVKPDMLSADVWRYERIKMCYEARFRKMIDKTDWTYSDHMFTCFNSQLSIEWPLLTEFCCIAIQPDHDCLLLILDEHRTDKYPK